MKIEVWKGKRGWYWHFRAANGKVTADSEAFSSRAHAIRAGKAVVRGTLRPYFGENPIFRSATADGITKITWS